ncbi:MAG TPA: twin-arginine translocase subunit TatC [Gemmata sp.]|nr:twin-arginine translocase subunit TatC [Gemmata sp.]
MFRRSYPDDLFAQSQMSFEDHLGELSLRLRRALAGVVLVTVVGVSVDFLGMYLKLPWLGFGFPALRFIAAPAEQEVDAFYRKRYEEATEKWLRTKGAGDRQSLAIGVPGSTGDRVELMVDVEPVELARLVKIGELAAGFRRPLTTLSAQEAMVTYFKVAIALAAIVASPWVFYQMWAFIAAGLYPHERHRIHAILPASVVLFLVGVVLCQFVVMPAVVRAMLEFNEWSGFDPDLRLKEWMGLAILLPVIFGISFQTPLVMAFLTWIGVTTSRTYLRYWRQAIFGLTVFVAAVMPTQDPITWSYLFVPMAALYLVGVGVSRLVEPHPEENPISCDV